MRAASSGTPAGPQSPARQPRNTHQSIGADRRDVAATATLTRQQAAPDRRTHPVGQFGRVDVDGLRRDLRWPERAARRSPSWITPRRKTKKTAERPRPAASRRTLTGPWGASFDGPTAGQPTRGLTFERRWTRPGIHPYDEITWETRTAGDRQRVGQARLRAEGRRGPGVLEPARHERRRQQVLPRPRRHAGARDERPPADRPRRQHDHRLGGDPALLRDATRTSQTFKAELTHLLVHQKMSFNSPVWFNVGIEKQPQCSACFINSVQDTMSTHHGPRQDRGDAVQVRLGRRQQPQHHPLAPARR